MAFKEPGTVLTQYSKILVASGKGELKKHKGRFS